MIHDHDPLTRYSHHDEPTRPLRLVPPPPERIPARTPFTFEDKTTSFLDELVLLGCGLVLGGFFGFVIGVCL